MSAGALSTVSLSGPEKAAAFLLLAGKEVAVRLADYFTEDELREIFAAAGRIGSLTVDEVETLVEEFRDRFVRSGLVKSPGSVEQLFADIRPGVSLAEFVTGVKQEVPVEVGPSTWQQIAAGGIEPIFNFVSEEHPQASAFLLSQIDQSLVAQVLERLPAELRNAVVLRLVDIVRRPGPITDEMERLIVVRFTRKQGDGADTAAAEKIANVLNELGKEQVDEIVGFLEQANPEKAAQIRKWLFRFELVEQLAQQDRAILFDGIAAEELARALSGATASLKDAVLSVLSQRNRRSVEAEMADANFSEEAILATQRKLARLAVSLSREGRIKLTSGETQPGGGDNGRTA